MSKVFIRVSIQGSKQWSLRRRIFTLVCAVFFGPLGFTLPAEAARIYPSAGTTSATFLKLGAGARALGMAGAFTAVADDPYAIYWNPAGLADLRGERNLGFYHNDYFQGLRQEFLVYTMPAEKVNFFGLGRPASGVLGAGLDYFRVPKDMERRSGINETDLSVSEGNFGAYDLALSLGYGRMTRRNIRLGGAVKVIRQSIDDRSGGSVALDAGALYDFSWLGENFTAGLAVQNIGPGVKFIAKRYDLPLNFKAGLSHRLAASGALLALDVSKPIDNYPFLTLGVEYPITSRLWLRSGYKYRMYGNELGAWSGFAAGMGLAFNRISFDYAFTPFGDLGNAHRFSFSLKFAAKSDQAAKTGATEAASASAAGGRHVAYETAFRPLVISARGSKYEMTAVTGDSEIVRLVFKTMVRGQPPADISMSEEELSGDLAGQFPSGLQPLRTWSFASGIGAVQGNIAFKLKLKKTAEDMKVAFLYHTGTGWEQVKADPAGSDESFAYFTAAAPAAGHYAIALIP